MSHILVAALIGAIEYRTPPVSPPPPPPPPPPPAVPLAATLNPATAYGERLGPGTVLSWRCALETSGGVSPYTYSAARVSGAFLNYSIDGDEIWFSATISNGQTLTAVYSFTVTDYDYTTVTKNIPVTLVSERTGPTGPGGTGDTGGTGGTGGTNPNTPDPVDPVVNPVADIEVSVDPLYAYGERTGAGDVTTNTVTITIEGGTPPYTVLTSYFSGAVFTINNPTTQSISFTKTGLAELDNFTGYYRIRVTDADGRQGAIIIAAQIRAWETTVVNPDPPSPPPPAPPPPAALSATIAPLSVEGERLGAGSVITNAVTVTPAGGTAPYTITMTYVSGQSFTIVNSATGVYLFSKVLSSNTSQTGTYRWTVTDAAAASVTGTLEATLTTLPTRGPGGSGIIP